MKYEILIESVSEIVNNELIYKDGLELVYNLTAENHKKLSEHFFYKINKVNGESSDEYEYTEEFEVDIANILIKFVVKDV